MPNERGHAAAVGDSAKAAVPRPWWLGGLVVALGCLCLYGAFSLPQVARYAGIGPGLFVTLVGSGLVLLGLLLLIQIAQGETFTPQDTEDASGSEKANLTALLTALAAATVPVLTMRALGVPLTALLSFTLVARAFGSRRTMIDIATGAILGSLAWFLFTRLGLQLGGFMPFAGI
ncbi:tripartite tricarboxylate transporter TctB family protein [Chelativorans sp. SCAU2101]|uniref:Tripartite tricarboxylate transporter TctB family protein n=1 Tax=Chelativorans petroleitrophicus TaxID=2975484 RepID=A0A9X3B5V9_9HYPH|nr:tripartite tricarboxylate transporter TctB family protein [Chelativorans petroleitrophicus]MCT8989723.1 tripartite tricarboxylate transporter TctB family protein [Chelativorans petroleitrophicus]